MFNYFSQDRKEGEIDKNFKINFKVINQYNSSNFMYVLDYK